MCRFRFCEMWRRVVWYMVTKFLYLEYRCKILIRERRHIPTRLYGIIYQNTVLFMACVYLEAMRSRNVLTNYKRLRNVQLWIYSILIVSGGQLWTYDRRKSESREVARHTTPQTRVQYGAARREVPQRLPLPLHAPVPHFVDGRYTCNSTVSELTALETRLILSQQPVAYRGGGGWGVQTHPPKFRRASKIVPNSTRFFKTVKNCWIWDANTPRYSEKKAVKF